MLHISKCWFQFLFPLISLEDKKLHRCCLLGLWCGLCGTLRGRWSSELQGSVQAENVVAPRRSQRESMTGGRSSPGLCGHCTSHGCTLCPATHGGRWSPQRRWAQDWDKALSIGKGGSVGHALLQEMVSIPSSPHSPAQGSAKACLGLGHVDAGEEQGPGLCGRCAVCQVAQDALEFTAWQIGFDVQERFQVPFAVEQRWAGVISSHTPPQVRATAPGCGSHPVACADVPWGASSVSGSPTQNPALSWDVWGREGNLQGKGENQGRIWNISTGFYSYLPLLSDRTGFATAWTAAPTQVYRLRLYEPHLYSYLTAFWPN